MSENPGKELVEISYSVSDNTNYIKHVYFESESPKAVKFTNQTSERYFWIPKSMIKHGWKNNPKLPQDLKINYSLELKLCNTE